MSSIDVLNGMNGATDNVFYLAQELTLNPDQVDMGTKNFSVNIPESWVKISRVVAIIAVLIWIGYAAWQFLNTKNQGRGLQRIGGIWPMIAAGAAAGMFWDPNNIVTFANFLLNVGTGLLSLISNVFSSR